MERWPTVFSARSGAPNSCKRGFGVSPPFDTAFLAISHNPWGSLLLTWAAICGGLFVGVGLLLGKKARLAAFILDVAFHVGIIITIGLWSFALVMIGAAALAANPMRGGVTGSYFAHESVKNETSEDPGGFIYENTNLSIRGCGNFLRLCLSHVRRVPSRVITFDPRVCLHFVTSILKGWVH